MGYAPEFLARPPGKGKHMRLRGPLVITSALGLAVLTVSLVAVWTSIDHTKAIRSLAVKTTITPQASAVRAQAITASAVQTTVTLNDYGATFAPPPANASPPLTVQQAWAQFIQSSTVGSGGTAIPSGTTVQLGLFTFAVGPSSGCGTTNCNKLIVQNGTAYSALNQLAYGYSYRSTCVSGNDMHPLPPSPCTQWWFIDANTGHMIIGMEQFQAG